MNDDNLTNVPLSGGSSVPRYASTDEFRSEFGDFRVNNETENLSDSETDETRGDESGDADNDPNKTDTVEGQLAN